MDANLPFTHVSPLPMESLFKPLIDLYGEEDPKRIATTLHSLVISAPPATLR